MAQAIEARGGHCERCGNGRRMLLEMHHWRFNGAEDRKVRTRRQMLKEVIAGKDTEIVIVCANCHKELHYFHKD